MFIVISTFFPSCKSYYNNLQPANGDVNCIKALAPQFSSNLYNAFVDVTKNHFSGILFFKLMPDSSLRIVFTNEIGVKFFDFSFAKDGAFTKYYILPKMDKKVVVNALRKDMEMVLMHPNLKQATLRTNGSENFIAIPDKKGHDLYVTDKACSKLHRIEKTSKRKPIEVIQLFNFKAGIPDSIDIHHKNFKFNISLKHVER